MSGRTSHNKGKFTLKYHLGKNKTKGSFCVLFPPSTIWKTWNLLGINSNAWWRRFCMPADDFSVFFILVQQSRSNTYRPFCREFESKWDLCCLKLPQDYSEELVSPQEIDQARFPTTCNYNVSKNSLIAFTIDLTWSAFPSPNSQVSQISLALTQQMEKHSSSQRRRPESQPERLHICMKIFTGKVHSIYLTYLRALPSTSLPHAAEFIRAAAGEMQLRCTAPTHAHSLTCTARRRNR